MTRCFVTYSGIKLPLNLLNELDAASLVNRNTFFRGHYDSDERLTKVEKIVYGEVEMQHEYDYHANGQLCWARITLDEDEVTELQFDEQGQPVR